MIEPGTTPTAQEVLCEEGHGVSFGDETVLLAPVTRRIRGAGVTAEAAAVLVSGEEIHVVAARRVEVAGRVVLDVSEPFTGRTC